MPKKDNQLAKTSSKVEITEEERERRRANMRKLQAEGKVGPQFGKLGGRPRKPRATEMAAEKARQYSDQITQVFIDSIDPSQGMKTRLEAANSWLKLEQQEAAMKLQEDKFDIENASKEQLVEELAGILSEGPLAEALQNQFGTDATGEDISDVEQPELGTASSDS